MKIFFSLFKNSISMEEMKQNNLLNGLVAGSLKVNLLYFIDWSLWLPCFIFILSGILFILLLFDPDQMELVLIPAIIFIKKPISLYLKNNRIYSDYNKRINDQHI